MRKQWIVKPKAPEALFAGKNETQQLGAQLLYNRGIENPSEVEAFLNPEYSGQNDPFLFADMAKAVDRIWQAVLQDEPICVYGDYDADAVTANAVIQQALRYVGAPASSYIPDRFTEGYGLNLEAFEKIRKQGCRVVITVDCGTNSRDAADFCRQHGIDLIITDHHEIIGSKPEAFALINPKNPDDSYPYRDITGVGVAFKLAAAFLGDKRIWERVPNHAAGWEKWLLDLVAIGTVADCHSLLGENRILVKFGLRVLQKTKWPGLKALQSAASLDFSDRAPDTYTLGFVIAPRLNAAGRLEHADIALHTLLETDGVKAVERAQALEAINRRRQEQTERIVSEAREQALLISDRKVLVVAGEGWSKGIVGLVAGKLAEEYHKPVIVLEKGVEECTGSARTAGDFDVVESLKYASDLLVRFGGHTQAAGLTLKTADLEAFYRKILEYAESRLNEADAERKLLLDAELEITQAGAETMRLVQSMEPYGVHNPKPKFLVRGVEIASLRPVGAQQQHLQMSLAREGKQISAIHFQAGDFAKTLRIGDTVDVAGELVEDLWNGRRNIKLRIVDMRPFEQ